MLGEATQEAVAAIGAGALEAAPKYVPSGAGGVFTPWLNADEAAEFVGMERTEFKRLAACGEIPRHALTERRFRYYAPELTDWLRSR